jgi:GntR family transcriptional regulator
LRNEQIAAELSREISTGQYPIGARFPTEQDLRDRFQVGRHTVREALKLLTEQGLLGRRRKTGTFVLSHAAVSPYVHSLRDFKALLEFADAVELDIHHAGGVSANSKLLSSFENLWQGRWFRVAGLRRRVSDGLPICWTELLVPDCFCPPREAILSAKKAVYEVIMAHTGLRLEYVEQEVTATLLPEAMFPLLQVSGDAAALLVKRRYVAHTGETFEISQNLYPASRYRLSSIIRQRA